MTPRAPSAALPGDDRAPFPEHVSLQAAQWLVALQAGDVAPATRSAWQAWRAAHPDHERAWQHVERFGASLRGLNAPLAHGTIVRADAGRRAGRRQAVKLLGVAAVAGTGLWLAREGTRGWTADHRTAVGERADIVLADGTRITLGTATAVDVRFDASQRLVSLRQGEILVSTAGDPDVRRGAAARPFLVQTAEGRLRALGTRFSVRQSQGRSRVSVFEGRVQVRPDGATGAPVVVETGQQAEFTRTAADAPEALHDPAQALSTWTTGMLVAREMPLGELVAELARFRPGWLTCDPAVAGLRVSGIYPLADTDRVLDMLQRTLAVRVRFFTRYWATVVPRDDG